MLYTDDYILNPTHRIKVALVGVGGTGSFILPELVMLSKTLEMLDRKPLEIHVYDDDVVEPHNCGRQKFFEADIGQYKSKVLCNRVNRAMSADCEYFIERIDEDKLLTNKYNIVISCVDSLKSRRIIASYFNQMVQIKQRTNRFSRFYYWLDCGNSKDFGQIILASPIDKNPLPHIFELHPNIKEKKNEPSCSLRASLNEQSFMINKLTGVYCLQILSTALLDFQIPQSEVYFSLNPINVKTNSL